MSRDSQQILIFIIHNENKKNRGEDSMKRKVWISAGAGIAIVFILFIFLSGIFTPGSSSASELTEQEAKEIVQQRYSGDIQVIKQAAGHYIIELERETGIYEIQINAETGEISSLERIQVKKEETSEQRSEKNQKAETEQVIDQSSENEQTTKNDQLTENKQVEEVQTMLSEEKAAVIALEQVPGEVDDVDVENINGVTHFLVEVETHDDREATVEINAITGEVKSITWDDHDDD